MNTTMSSTLDLGPLSWVKTEIEHSLAEARANLDRMAIDPSDAKALKYVSTHLHQVTGALSMVGLGAATRFTEEIEALVAALGNADAHSALKERVALAKQATGSLSAYLDGLMSGEADRPMSLVPAYLSLNRGRGENNASESDLFSPDLSIVVPMPEDTVALPKSDMLIEAVKQRRGLYQAGLLKILREKDLVGGARDMRNATLAIEALQVTSPTRAFWFTVTGFFDAVGANPAEAGSLAVQLFGKIDQQIKLVIDGVQKVPERLFRDLLLVIGKSKASTERVRDIRALYRLNELLAAAPESDVSSNESVRALVRSLRDLVQSGKENWLKFTSGNRTALDAFAEQGDALARQSQQLSNAGMAELLRVIGLIGPHLRKTGASANEVQALEVASALLFVESSLENFARLSPEFIVQSQGVIGRIKGAMSGTPLPALDASTNALMDDFTKRAQERLLMFQVGQEIQVNLSTIESTLDGFFRDHVKTTELASLPGLFAQVQGALAILDLNEAAALNQMLRDRVLQFSTGAIKGAGDDAEAVAEGVSALGLFISALQQSSTDPRAVLLPALVRFGLADNPAASEGSLIKAPVSTADVDVDKQKVQALYSDWKQQPEDTASRDHLREAVKELKQNAEIAGDVAAVRSSEASLEAIDASFDPMKPGVTDALANIAPAKPADTPAPQVVQLLDAPASEVDQELLDIFLEEAAEVVASIRENLAALGRAQHDKEALITIRRGFHTLKGSGRMVGLNDLGDVAWSCEQVMNKWLKDEKILSAGLLLLLTESSDSFGRWVRSLQNNGNVTIDGARIDALCDLLKNDKEPVIEMQAIALASVDTPVGVEVQTKSSIVEPSTNAPLHELPPLFDAFVAVGALAATANDAAQFADLTPAATELAATANEETGLDDLIQPDIADFVPFTETSGAATTTVPTAESTDIFAELPALDQAFSGPSAEVLVPADAPPVVADIDEILVGHIRLSQPLYEIYLTESSVHVEVLEGEMAGIEANPRTPVSHEFMRAAHTLTSSSRTTGFESIASVAFALEKWLTGAIELAPEFSPERIRATRQAVDTLADMVLSLHTREYPAARPDIVSALIQLREQLKSGARGGEATYLRTPQATVDAPASVFAAADAGPMHTDKPPADAPASVAPPVADQAEKRVDPATIFGIASAGALVAAAAFDGTKPPVEPTNETAGNTSAATYNTSTADAGTASAAPDAEPVFESGRDRRAVKDDIDNDLLPIFLEEAGEIAPLVGDALRRWRAAPVNHEPVSELARHLHTLKGSARMAGLMRLGELAHAMETRIIEMDRVETPAPGAFDAIDDRLDRFNNVLESLNAGDLAPIIEIPIESAVAAEVPSQLPAPMAAIAAVRAEIVAEGEKLEGRERQALLRVNADLIDRFVNEAGELAIARSRVDLELQAFKKALLDLNDNVARMKVQLREIEIGAESQIQSRIKEAENLGEQFDPLEFDRFSRMQELTRFMAESLNDVVTLQQSLAKNIDEADSALLQQSRLNRDLQQGLMGVRLVPLGNLQDRFYRLVRQTAKEIEKKANLEFRGVRVEIDRSVLEKITAPLEHLLRNAVAHGVESPAERLAAGKSEIGEISIDARQIGNEVVLTLSDDGTGLNFKRIREKAIEKGMIEANADVSDAQLTQFIFAAGFSTAQTVSQVSGRGVGMDVVRNEIVSLGGRIDIASNAGRGTTFTIALPLTLAVTQAVMVTVGDTTYAIPSVMIEQVQEFKGKRYEPLLALNEIDWKGNKYPLRSMEVILGGKPKVSAQRHAFVILAKSAQQRAAVQVDDIIGNREIVVKSIGPQLARIPGIAGATVLGSGQVVLIMNPVQLVFREAATVTLDQGPASAPHDLSIAMPSLARVGSDTMAAPSSSRMDADREQVVPAGLSLADAFAASVDSSFMASEVTRARANPLVMVVDDSLTVRKITSRMLTRENFEVATAKDGVDGLQQLQDIEPDLILLDIEMPRMDGFEFARNVRADVKTKHIPIIMITSRTADKHRNRAIELGVNEYMGKPYQEEQLLALIRQYTKRKAAA